MDALLEKSGVAALHYVTFGQSLILFFGSPGCPKVQSIDPLCCPLSIPVGKGLILAAISRQSPSAPRV